MSESEWRGIFKSDEEDPEYWREACREFPNGVPRFQSKAECTKFIHKYCRRGSNPFEPQLRQSISTLTDWEQVSTVLMPKYRAYQDRWPRVAVPTSAELKDNRFISAEPNSEGRAVYDFLLSRLNLPIHTSLNANATLNTLQYLFLHMRCGVLAMIRNNELVIFCPFVNKHYRNTWSDKLRLDCADDSVESYFAEKETRCRAENYLRDKAMWWANGNIICNEVCKEGQEAENQWWGDQFLLQLKDMLSETCRTRVMPDCDLFLNKRDYPQIKFNPQRGAVVEPYGFIFDKDDKDPAQDVPLEESVHFRRYAPVLSFYTSSRFADIPFPPSEDWEAATGEVFPPSLNYTIDEREPAGIAVGTPRDLFTKANLDKFERPWEEKVPVAFFRGTATGGGTTIDLNQRLHLAHVSWQWERDPALNGSGGGGDPAHPYLDAKITGWNLRDKKVAGKGMNHVIKENFPFNGDKAKNFVEIYKQSSYKYLLYVEGHCAACRYGFMMLLGSVILKVDSKCVADQMWYFPLLKPFFDHVPVKADLSDLKEKIEWCRAHDAECRQIAANALEVYKSFVSKDAILDYMQAVCVEVARRSHSAPAWASNAPEAEPAPSSRLSMDICPAGCRACAALSELDKEESRRSRETSRKETNRREAEDAEKKVQKNRLRERMKRIHQKEQQGQGQADSAPFVAAGVGGGGGERGGGGEVKRIKTEV